MRDITQKNTTLSAAIGKLPANSRARVEWQKDLAKWGLVSWEDTLFYQLFYFLDKEDDGARAYVEEMVAAMRGEDPETKEFTPAEIKVLVFSKELLENAKFQKRVMRTLYYSLNLDLAPLILAFIEKLENEIFGEEGAITLRIVDELFYRLVYLTAAMNYFHLLSDQSHYFIFGGGSLPLALRVGFNMEQIMRQTSDILVGFYRRRDLSLDLAAFMTENETEFSFGTAAEEPRGGGLTLKDLINLFRNYSKNDFSGTNLVNFLNDPEYAAYFGPGDKEVARELLELYVHLVNGFFIVPDGDFEKLKQRIKEMELAEKEEAAKAVATPEQKTEELEAETKEEMPEETEVEEKSGKLSYDEIKKRFGRRFIMGPDGQLEMLEEVLKELGRLSEAQGDAKIAELYYFDEKEGKFKWAI